MLCSLVRADRTLDMILCPRFVLRTARVDGRVGSATCAECKQKKEPHIAPMAALRRVYTVLLWLRGRFVENCQPPVCGPIISPAIAVTVVRNVMIHVFENPTNDSGVSVTTDCLLT